MVPGKGGGPQLCLHVKVSTVVVNNDQLKVLVSRHLVYLRGVVRHYIAAAAGGGRGGGGGG